MYAGRGTGRFSCFTGGRVVWGCKYFFCFSFGGFSMLHNVFDEYPGFKFFSAEDVLKVRSLGLPESTYDWLNEHFELVSSVLGVSTEFMYERLNEAFEGGSAGWCDYCEWGEGASLSELETQGLSRGEVMRLYEEGCLNGGIWEGDLLFTRAQFWGGAGETTLRFNPEFFECVKTFRAVGVEPHITDDFLFTPSPEYGFLSAAELLLSGDEALVTLALEDARECALKRRTDIVGRAWVRAGEGNVPAPGNVVALTEAGIVPSASGGSLGDLGALAEVLRVPWGVLVRRFAEVDGRSDGVRWAGLPPHRVADGSGVSEDALVGMCESGELLSGRYSDGDCLVEAVHLMPVYGDDGSVVDWVFFPGSVRLVAELRDWGWGSDRIVQFLEEPSPWFGLVAPVEYARLGDEYVDAVLAVARYT